MSFRLYFPEAFACEVCGLSVSIEVSDGPDVPLTRVRWCVAVTLSLVHAHGGCDVWRDPMQRPRCVGRVRLKGWAHLWPAGDDEYGSIGR